MAVPVGRARRRRLWSAGVALVILGGVVLALRSAPSGQPPPAQVLYGVDTCVECGMVVTEPRSGAQLIAGGKAVMFCDVGCLVVYQLRHHPGWSGVQAAYVPDWNTLEWIDAREAWWVTTRHKTPMLYGLVTVKTRAAADDMAREHEGQVMSYDETTALDLLREEARR